MHYKNGRVAKLGDRIVGRDCGGILQAGTVVSIQVGAPGGTTCALQVIAPASLYVTLGECLHLDDAVPILPMEPSQAS
jgi:hypothetical protein